jgi:hypothetical protein
MALCEKANRFLETRFVLKRIDVPFGQSIIQFLRWMLDPRYLSIFSGWEPMQPEKLDGWPSIRRRQPGTARGEDAAGAGSGMGLKPRASMSIQMFQLPL